MAGPTDTKYSITLISHSDASNVTGKIYGPVSFDASGAGINVKLIMVKDGSDYFIKEIWFGLNPSSANLKKLR